MNARHFALFGIALVVTASAAGAQSAPAIEHRASREVRQPYGPFIEGGAVFVALNGSDFSGVADGIGADLLAGYSFGPFKLAAGVQHTSHDVDDVSENVMLDVGFIEPRYELDLGAGTVTPYLFGRFGGVTEKLNSPTRPFEAKGYMAGAGGGIRLQVARTLSFNLSALYTRIAIDDVVSGGAASPGSDTEGSGFVARAGFQFRFGGSAR
jgi:hypothetical protein